MKCGLLGRKLSHSYSPQIHSHFGDYEYALYEKEPEELENFLKTGNFHGLNVTTPYKKTVLPFCDALSPLAEKLGAVNTLIRQADGTLYGHNSDYYGFSAMVTKSGLQLAGKKVLVLGSGGASTTAVAVLEELHASVVVISRNGVNNYQNLHLHADAAAIVNTTPVGMYPDTDNTPLDLQRFPNLEGVLDIIYNPARTRLLQQAESLGLQTENGLWMLIAQAKESAELFLGYQLDSACIRSIHNLLSRQMQNVILIGMPGAGKSTIGKLLAQAMHMPFIDSDEKIADAAGITIADIFSQGGETKFRRIETEVLSSLGKQSGYVIATGGGCVTIPENYPLLHQNGKMIWLKRAVDDLPTVGRPLSKGISLEKMLQVRTPLYQAFADLQIDNHGAPEETVSRIIQMLKVAD